MERDEEIIKASTATFKENGDEFASVVQLFWISAFLAGAKWADEHPKDVWHSADEEPVGKYEILVQDEFGHFWLTDYVEDVSHYQMVGKNVRHASALFAGHTSVICCREN